MHLAMPNNTFSLLLKKIVNIPAVRGSPADVSVLKAAPDKVLNRGEGNSERAHELGAFLNKKVCRWESK